VLNISKEIRISGNDSAFPDDCSVRAAAQTVMRFFDAVNTGDKQQIQRFIGPRFEWFNLVDNVQPTPERNFSTTNPYTVVSQLMQRHEQHEQLELLVAQMSYEEGRHIVHTYAVLRREADDFEPNLGGPERLAVATGAVDCRDQTLMVWGMGSWVPKANKRPLEHAPACWWSLPKDADRTAVHICVGTPQE
jgi:hypothetical protein